MKTLFARCPHTERVIETGLFLEADDQRIPDGPVDVFCPECHDVHKLPVFLADPLPSRPQNFLTALADELRSRDEIGPVGDELLRAISNGESDSFIVSLEVGPLSRTIRALDDAELETLEVVLGETVLRLEDMGDRELSLRSERLWERIVTEQEIRGTR